MTRYRHSVTARVVIVCSVIAGCGRIHYDPRVAATDAGRDAFVPPGVDADLDALVIVDPDAAIDAATEGTDTGGGGPGLCDDERVVTTTAAAGPGSWAAAISTGCPTGDVCITFDLPPEMRGPDGFVVGSGSDVTLDCAQMSVRGSTQAMRRGETNTGSHAHPVGGSDAELRIDDVEVEITDRLIFVGSEPTLEGVAVYGVILDAAASDATLDGVIIGASPRFETRPRRDPAPALLTGSAGATVIRVYVASPDGFGDDAVVSAQGGNGATFDDLDVHAGAPPSAGPIVWLRGPSGVRITHSSARGPAPFDAAFLLEEAPGAIVRECTGEAAGASCQFETVDSAGPTLSGNVGNLCIR